MLHITTNLNEVLADLDERILRVDMRRIGRIAASNVVSEIKQRIHVEGKAADGSQIGTYSEGYMKVRTDNFQSKTVNRGKDKGKTRTLYKRSNDKKVIASLTRDLENRMTVIPLHNGAGIGWHNLPPSFDKVPSPKKHVTDYDKTFYVEATYGKEIWSFSEKEKDIIRKTVDDEMNKIFR